MSDATSPGGRVEVTGPVREGEVLAGKYRIERVLGAGGMGVVVAALHLQLEQRVAIKFLLPDALRNPEVVGRFAREAKAAAKIQSEHVARVLDVGQLESGAPYMVMEHLEGADLGDVLTQRGPLPVEDAAGYVLQACEAIAEAHAAGIVHRDLKPSNLFLARRTSRPSIVKVLDFGISKAETPEGDAALTKTSAMLGSPLYMSPEQLKATKRVDPRSDVWSLGVILYELVTGNRPFYGETISEVIAAILSEPPPPIREARPDVPEAFEAVVLGCLQKKADQRTGNIALLAQALAPFAPADQRMSVERIVRVLGPDALKGSIPPAASKAAAAASDAPPTAALSAAVARTEAGPAWQQTGAPTAQTQPAAPTPPRKLARTVAIALAVAVVGGVAVALALSRTGTQAPEAMGSGRPPSGSAAPSQAPTAAAPTAPADPKATGPTPPPTAPPEASSPPAASATARPSGPAAPLKTTTTTTAPPPTTAPTTTTAPPPTTAPTTTTTAPDPFKVRPM